MTKRKLSLLGIALVISTVVAISCSKEISSSGIDENTIAKRLTFVNVNARIKAKEFLQKRIPIVIVEWDEWGRGSKDCRGWGLCNANWFPDSRNNETTNGGATLLEFDNTNNKYYIDILLEKPVPDDLPKEAITIKIDTDFMLNVEKIISKNLIFHQGEYPFNSALGQFGGYRIYLD